MVNVLFFHLLLLSQRKYWGGKRCQWSVAALNNLLSNEKYISVVGIEQYIAAQFLKSTTLMKTREREGPPDIIRRMY